MLTIQADKEILSNVDAKRCGSTASVALIHSLDEPAQPFWAAKRLSITVGHCGYVVLTYLLIADKK